MFKNLVSAIILTLQLNSTSTICYRAPLFKLMNLKTFTQSISSFKISCTFPKWIGVPIVPFCASLILCGICFKNIAKGDNDPSWNIAIHLILGILSLFMPLACLIFSLIPYAFVVPNAPEEEKLSFLLYLLFIVVYLLPIWPIFFQPIAFLLDLILELKIDFPLYKSLATVIFMMDFWKVTNNLE